MSSVAHKPMLSLGDEHSVGAPLVDPDCLPFGAVLGVEGILQDPSRRRAVHIVGVVAGGALAALLAGAVAYAALWPPPTDRLGPSPLLGRAAPKFNGDQVIGQPDPIFPARGRWVVVNFFATWCRPCRKEVPELVRFAGGHGSEVGLVTVTYNDDAEQARAFIESRGGRWSVLADGSGVVSRQYALRAVPDTFLIDPDGIVVAAFIGGVTSEGLESTLLKFQSQRTS